MPGDTPDGEFEPGSFDDGALGGDPTGGFDDDAFDGVARLFPLAGVSMLPGIIQPLHIFEERYRAMMEDALAGDQLIAMAVLRPGWENDYPGRPPLEEVACLGRIVTHHRLPDGRFNLLLAGLRRVRIEHEIEPPEAFRRASVRIMPEILPSADNAAAGDAHRRLVEAFRAELASSPSLSAVDSALDGDLPLSLLTDLVAYTLPLEHGVKRDLLLEPDALNRAERLLSQLAAPADDFPPPFSAN